MSYLLHLEYPPSINDYYGISCHGKAPHKYIKERGKQHRTKTMEYVQAKDLEIMANIPLFITLTITPPDNGVHDIDGVLKCLFDSVTHSRFWEDDSYIRKLLIEYAPPVKGGSILLHAEALI